MAEREIKYRGLKTFQIFSGEKKSVWIYGFYLRSEEHTSELQSRE